MATGVSKEYIDGAIKELSDVVGIRKPITQQPLVLLLRNGEVKQCIKDMALMIGLPIDISLTSVPQGYSPYSQNRFHSKDLVKTDRSGKGEGGITAQVSIPQYLPLFGSPTMSNYVINVRVSENCCAYPLTFMAVMAHELSHILLEALRYSKKNNEVCIDLTAMMIGFSEIIQTGRKVIEETQIADTIHTRTTTYGYLTDDQFFFALKRINYLLKRYKQRKRKLCLSVGSRKIIISKIEGNILRFKKFMAHLDEKQSCKIRKNDSIKIVNFHSPNYLSEMESNLNHAKTVLLGADIYVKNVSLYIPAVLEQIHRHSCDVKAITTDLKAIFRKSNYDVAVLRRNVGMRFAFGMEAVLLRSMFINMIKKTVLFIKSCYH